VKRLAHECPSHGGPVRWRVAEATLRGVVPGRSGYLHMDTKDRSATARSGLWGKTRFESAPCHGRCNVVGKVEGQRPKKVSRLAITYPGVTSRYGL
jgi:hypothetical protein